jgi:hypothetical protein
MLEIRKGSKTLPMVHLNFAHVIAPEVALAGKVANADDHFKVGVESGLGHCLHPVGDDLDVAPVEIVAAFVIYDLLEGLQHGVFELFRGGLFANTG